MCSVYMLHSWKQENIKVQQETNKQIKYINAKNPLFKSIPGITSFQQLPDNFLRPVYLPGNIYSSASIAPNGLNRGLE